MFHTFPENIAIFFEHQWVFFIPKDMWQEGWKFTKLGTWLPNHIIAKKVIARTQADTTMCNCCRRRLPSPFVSCVSSSGREFCVKSLVTSRLLQLFSLSSLGKCLGYSIKLSVIFWTRLSYTVWLHLWVKWLCIDWVLSQKYRYSLWIL